MFGSKLLRPLYATIVINLVLWLAMLGAAFRGVESVRAIAIAGFVFAALAQHWAFYALRKVEPVAAVGVSAESCTGAKAKGKGPR